MDSGFQEKEEKQVKLLTVACRFVPYDQWLVTHVDSSWTITQVKSWILAKCIANNSIGSPPSPSPNLPPINPPTKPKTKPARRPASPIIFAEFSPVDGNPARAPGHNLDEPVKEEKPKRRKRRGRGRPISPITFAPIGNGDQGDESDYDPFKTQEAEGEVIGMGYEEDDEWESSEEGTDIDELELELDSKPRRGRRANRNQYLGFHDRPLADQQSPALPPSATSRALTKINPAAIPRGSFSTYHPRLLTVIRFSTGQILEKHYTVQDYELKPYELLEIHRLGVVAKLPREVTSKYIEPYWEGWVKALRVVFREPRAVAEVREGARRHAGTRKDAPVEELLKTALDGVYMAKSINPHAESARRTLDVLAGGPVPMKVPALAPPDVALGLRHPAPRNKAKKSMGSELDLITSMASQSAHGHSASHLDSPSLGRSATMPLSSKASLVTAAAAPSASSGGHSRKKGGQLEWRERWIFIKDGVLHLKKENSESPTSTTQTLPLDSLAEIRNADHISRVASEMSQQQQTSSARIVCAKFKTRITTKSSNAAATAEWSNNQAPSTNHHGRTASLGKIVSNHVGNGTPAGSAVTTHSSKPSRSSTTTTIITAGAGVGGSSGGGRVPSSSKTPAVAGSSYIESGSGAHYSSQASSTRTSPVIRPISPLLAKPKIMLQIKPLPPPAPTPRVVQGKERTSSLAHIASGMDKGKGKAPATATAPAHLLSDIPSGPPSEAASENLDEDITDEDGAASEDEYDEVDAGDLPVEKKRKRKKKQKEKRRESGIPHTHITTAERRHPAITMTSDVDTNGSGGTLSSPVFAHSEDEESPLSDGPGLRSYGYGFSSNPDWRKRKGGGGKAEDSWKREQKEGEENVEADTSYVVVDGPSFEQGENASTQDRQKINASKATLSSRHSGGNRERPDPESEWIVLDLGDDFAFKSFLRVIHRYAPHVVDSSFLSSLPEPQIPNRPSNDGYPAAPAPTPNFTTPFPSPNQSAPSTSLNQWSWNTARQEQVRRPIAEEISPIATPVVERPVSPNAGQGTSSPPSLDTVAENVSEPASSGANNTPAGTQTPVVPPRDSKLYRLPPSPTYERMRAAPSSSQTSPVMSAAFLGRRPSGPKHIQTSRQKKSLSTFGALPYPEWRLEIVTKAQRAGMGELTRAMDQFLWSDNPGLALLSREFGLSLGPMEMIRSPSIHTAAGDRFSLNGDGDSTEDATSIRKEKRRRRKMTMEQENIAMGLDLAGNAPFSGNSSKTLNEPSQQSTVSSSTGNSVSEHSLTSTLPGVSEDSRSSLKLGFVDEDSSESGEESSDAEWLGWMADLHRQARLQRVQGERNRLETESLGSETDLFDYWDYQQQDDHRRYQQERKALEPFAIVTSSSPVPTVPSTPVTSTIQGSFIASEYSHSRGLGSTASVETSNASSTSHRPATPVGHIGGPSAVLTSPSSNESLGKKQGRRLSYGLSPSDPPSSATSPSLSQIGHSVEITHHKHEHVSSRSSMHHRPISGMVRDGPHLSHYASTGLIGSGSLASARDTESTNSSLTSGRRPSMPSLSSLSSVARSDGSSSPSVVPSASATASTSSGWPPVERWGASVSLARSIVLQTSQPQPQLSEHTIRATMPRRSSITGLAINPASSSSVSRSSSMLGKGPGLLRKKEPEIAKVKRVEEVDRDRDMHPSKGKEKSRKGKERERTPELMQEVPGEGWTHRPRLSLSMDPRQASTSGTVSPPPTSPNLGSKGRIRRMRSGQSLFSGEEGAASHSNASIRNKSPPVKKKSLVREKAEKLLQGLESTLDFVDAR